MLADRLLRRALVGVIVHAFGVFLDVFYAMDRSLDKEVGR